MPKLILSDMHYHGWSQFSTVLESGINSRLQDILSATDEAIDHLLKEGGNEVFLAGDTFHVRGAVAPSVLNPVLDLFGRRIVEDGIRVFAIPGNHDLEGNTSERLSNAVAALEKVGVEVAHEPMTIGNVCLFPWFPSVGELVDQMKATFKGLKEPSIAIVHAPVDGVLPHIPSHGLTGDDLGAIGYQAVFCGHYHNHVKVHDQVWSVGALTHQTWNDVNSKAGYILYDEDKNQVRHFESSAPKFIDLTGEEDPETLDEHVSGNFVRVKCEIDGAGEMNEIRQEILDLGAVGVVVHPIKKTTVTRSAAPKAGAGSLEEAISDYVKAHSLCARVERTCIDVLAEARGVE